ncbi:MAG: hypothetical protein ACRDHO_13635 [Actinomycetota bacterium]
MGTAVEVRAWMRQQGGRWVAGVDGDPAVRASGASRERCLQGLRRALERQRSVEPRQAATPQPLTLVVEVFPVLAGVAEAAEVMGWDKRRVITYIDRGRFPEPLQSLASGRVWFRADVERYATDWRSRRARRAKRTPTR